MADLLRLIVMIALLGAGLCGLVFVPTCAMGFARMAGGSPGFWDYLFVFVISLPAFAGAIGLILLARKLYKDSLP
jgi:hypothetical protein